jgi:hypothetical protein
MQVFDDEEQILNFMHGEKDFYDCLIDEVQDGKEISLIQLRFNHINVGLVPLENMFDRSDRFLNKIKKIDTVDVSSQFDEINVGSKESPHYIKIGKACTEKE